MLASGGPEAQKPRILLAEVRTVGRFRISVVVHLGKGSIGLLALLGLVFLSLVWPAIVVRILENFREIAKGLGLP